MQMLYKTCNLFNTVGICDILYQPRSNLMAIPNILKKQDIIYYINTSNEPARTAYNHRLSMNLV